MVGVPNHHVADRVLVVVVSDGRAVSELDLLEASDAQPHAVEAGQRCQLARPREAVQVTWPVDNDRGDGRVMTDLLDVDAAAVGENRLVGLAKNGIERLAELMAVLHEGDSACHDHLHPEQSIG